MWVFLSLEYDFLKKYLWCSRLVELYVFVFLILFITDPYRILLTELFYLVIILSKSLFSLLFN